MFISAQFRRYQRKENQEKLTSKHAPFSENMLYNRKSTKSNKVSTFNTYDRLSQRSGLATTNFSEYHIDQNRRTTIDELKLHREKTIKDNQVKEVVVSKENINTNIPIAKREDVLDVNISNVFETRLRIDTIRSASTTLSVRVIKIPRSLDRNESLSAILKSKITKLNHLNLPSQVNKESSSF